MIFLNDALSLEVEVVLVRMGEGLEEALAARQGLVTAVVRRSVVKRC